MGGGNGQAKKPGNSKMTGLTMAIRVFNFFPGVGLKLLRQQIKPDLMTYTAFSGLSHIRIKNRGLTIGNMLLAGFLTNFVLRIILNMSTLVYWIRA